MWNYYDTKTPGSLRIKGVFKIANLDNNLLSLNIKQMTKFIVDGPNKKGRYHVIEGWVMPGNVFNVKRFICEICSQETDKEMVEIANLIQKGLTAYTDLTDYHEDEENP